MSKEDNNDVIFINLDRPRQLRYGHKAIKQLLALTGINIEEVDPDNINLDDLEKYIYCGLLADAKEHGETLELKQMEDLLDQAPTFSHIIGQMTKALTSAFGDGIEGNFLAPAANPASTDNGTGTNP